jgi:hypothetical protein
MPVHERVSKEKRRVRPEECWQEEMKSHDERDGDVKSRARCKVGEGNGHGQQKEQPGSSKRAALFARLESRRFGVQTSGRTTPGEYPRRSECPQWVVIRRRQWVEK